MPALLPGRPLVLTLVVVLWSAVLAGPGMGQQGAITASVEVTPPPVTGAGLRTLDFGVVVPGNATEVLPDMPLSGWFQLVNVGRNKDVRLSFTFPTFLTAPGGAGMPARFDGPYVRSCGNACQTHMLTPASISATETSAEVVHVRPSPYGANPRTIDIYVGGRVEPPTGQARGEYQGTIRLTFAVI